MRPLRIVMLFLEPPVNAAARWYYVLLRELVARGHRVTCSAACSQHSQMDEARRLFPSPDYTNTDGVAFGTWPESRGGRGRETPSTPGWLTGIIVTVCAVGGMAIGIACFITVFSILFLRRQDLGACAFTTGSISYSSCLTHGLIGGRVISLGKRFGEGATYEVGLVVLALATSMLFAVVFSGMIETPAVAASKTIRLYKLPG